MTPERWQHVNALCQQAFELPEARRAAFLDEACADDLELRRQVDVLLAADRDAGTFLDSPAIATPLPGDQRRGLASRGLASPLPGPIGPYRLLRQLGQGGMSTVYLAERADDHFRKRVALKVIRQGMETRDRLRRFEAERQILAGLDHPHIARLLDGGTTEAGLPYFVLEYVEGEAIDDYCDRHRLSVAERLQLFRQICAAVHFAHQNMVVHRDLKPTNILVTEDGTPKLLDFGIAKLLNAELSFQAPSAPTLTWQRVLTPAYASPEQVQGRAITTASDVYSLGVLLYRLLTGRLPHRTAGLSPGQLEEVLTHQPPEKPSVVIDQTPSEGDGPHSDLETVSRQRNARPAELRRQLSGDLDHITAMALRAEPQRRYGSAAELSEDVRHHLEGHPVLARKGTFSYHAGKFLRRNRLGVGIAAGFLLLLLTSAIGMSFLALRLSHERDKAERVAGFLEQLLQASNPFSLSPLNAATNSNITVPEPLERGAQEVDREFAEQPELRASLLHTIGTAQRRMGHLERARDHLQSALQLRRQMLSAPHPDIAETLNELATVSAHEGDVETAEQFFQQALDMRRELYGERHPDIAGTLLGIAYVNVQAGDFEAAEARLLEILDQRGDAFDAASPNLASARELLSDILVARGDYSAAERVLREALDIWQHQFGDDHPTSFSTQGRLAYVHSAQGRYQEAEELSLRLLERWHEAVGEDHPDLATVMNNLSNVYYYQGDYASAEQYVRQALEINRRFLGQDHPQIITNTHNLATMLAKKGDFGQAIALHQQNLERRRRVQGENHPRIANTLDRLAEAHALNGDIREAEALYRQALAFRREHLGEHPKVAESLHNLAQHLADQGRWDAAEPLLREGVNIYQQTLQADHPRRLEAEAALHQCLRQLGHSPDLGASSAQDSSSSRSQLGS